MLKSWDLKRRDKTIKKKERKKERKGVCRKISEVMNPHPEGGCDQKEADTWSRQVGKPMISHRGPMSCIASKPSRKLQEALKMKAPCL